MKDLSAQIMDLSPEPALLARRGRVYHANAAARELLGEDCCPGSLKELLGETAAQVQAPCFAMDLSIKGQRYALRSSTGGGTQVIFLRRLDGLPRLLNQALIVSLKNSLMNFSLARGVLSERAALLEDVELNAGLRSVTHSYHRMLRVLDNASLALSAAEGSQPFQPVETDMDRFIQVMGELVSFLRPDIRLDLNTGKLGMLVVDRRLVDLMLMNLISNSLCHGCCTRIGIGAVSGRDSLILSVDDDGRGIGPQELATVFDRYSHGFDLSSIVSGAGLGLTVARQVASLHQGALLLESRQGQGTTVRVSLSRGLSPVGLMSPQTPWRADLQSALTALSGCLGDELYTPDLLD